MRNMILFIAIGMVFLVGSLSARINNVPGDYSTIQLAIDASMDGDTVLVQPDTYFENLNFNGNNITLGSLYLITGDTGYISTTVIDGQNAQWASVITLVGGEDNTAMITGFTIQNGISFNGGGISCTNGSNPEITHNIIIGNVGLGGGGGIYCGNSDPVITRNRIIGNGAPGAEVGFGGGIFCENSNPIISFNLIAGNATGGSEFTGGYGGGIFCDNSNPDILNNTVVQNSASSWAGGIYCASTSGPVIKNSIIRGNFAPHEPELEFDDSSTPSITYCDISGSWAGDGNIDCDPMFCDPADGDYYLADSSCCLGAGEGGVDIGAYGIGCGEQDLYEYLPGDVNMYLGGWPPDYPITGGDVTYFVNFFRGMPTSQPCLLDGFWCSADINGDCFVVGGDVTRLVNYFRGMNDISHCPDYPPAWLTPDDLPELPPPGWPNCE